MGIDHRGADILMSKKLLNRSNIVPLFQQVCSEGVAEGRPLMVGFLNDRTKPTAALDVYGCLAQWLPVFSNG